tara:strand:+ start:3508 stop:4398 length:891 start_codon:yes stop_codon:yes gene_type:complete
MRFLNRYISKIFNFVFSKSSQSYVEKSIITIAIASFIVHLSLILATSSGVISVALPGELLQNPLAAIYTPFSFILIYEVYLLIFYLPQSFTYYLSKQYEIITLIVLRRFFKDISVLDFNNTKLSVLNNLTIFYDIVAAIIMFLLVYFFRKNLNIKDRKKINLGSNLKSFIIQKKFIAISLLPLFLLLALESFQSWIMGMGQDTNSTNINHIFFEQFFTFLIFVDISILLLSFYYKNDFHKIIRNSGFIISTVIIRISFGITGLMNLSLLLMAILIGIAVQKIHNLYENDLQSDKNN